jgi:hypothetical protein
VTTLDAAIIGGLTGIAIGVWIWIWFRSPW